MRRAAPFLLVIALAAAAGGDAAAQSDDPTVIVAKVEGSLDRTLVAFVRDVLRDAEDVGATVVLQLDSAGTLDQDAVALAERVHEATIPVIVWVGPSPAKAQGAGLLLMYAASLGAVAPGAGLGPLHPLDLAGADRLGRSAVTDLARGWMSDRARGTPSFPDAPIPAQAALEGNIAEVAAVSVPGLLAEVDGMSVGTGGGEVVLATKIATTQGEEQVNVRFTELGPIDRVLHASASPTWIFVLLVLGLAALAFELTQPGFGFAGFAGVAMLVLATYGLSVVPFSAVGLGLLLLGTGLMTLDLRLRRFGPLTGGGLLAFAAGSVLLFGGVAKAIDVSPWLIGSFVVGSFLYWGFLLTVAVHTRERLTSRQSGLVGLAGETRGDLEPEGPVFVKGALWRGRSVDGPIPSGTRVRVRAVEGLILHVEPDPRPSSGE
jgi:membrane-bound serine protease (ClpP class)